MPVIAHSDQEINDCFDVMFELRPHLKRSQFLVSVRAMEQEGFKLVFIEEGDEVVAVAGYRISINLFMGKHLYVDDLITAAKQRSKGYGEKLIHWLRNLAKMEDCTYLHLDSGTHRSRAHKFYFEQGFAIASYHFSEALNEKE